MTSLAGISQKEPTAITFPQGSLGHAICSGEAELQKFYDTVANAVKTFSNAKDLLAILNVGHVRDYSLHHDLPLRTREDFISYCKQNPEDTRLKLDAKGEPLATSYEFLAQFDPPRAEYHVDKSKAEWQECISLNPKLDLPAREQFVPNAHGIVPHPFSHTHKLKRRAFTHDIDSLLVMKLEGLNQLSLRVYQAYKNSPIRDRFAQQLAPKAPLDLFRKFIRFSFTSQDIVNVLSEGTTYKYGPTCKLTLQSKEEQFKPRVKSHALFTSICQFEQDNIKSFQTTPASSSSSSVSSTSSPSISSPAKYPVSQNPGLTNIDVSKSAQGNNSSPLSLTSSFSAPSSKAVASSNIVDLSVRSTPPASTNSQLLSSSSSSTSQPSSTGITSLDSSASSSSQLLSSSSSSTTSASTSLSSSSSMAAFLSERKRNSTVSLERKAPSAPAKKWTPVKPSHQVKIG